MLKHRFSAGVGRFAPWLVVGVLGGAAAGFVDAAFSALRLWDQIGGVRRAQLFALGLALGAGVGVLLAAVSATTAWVVGRACEGVDRRRWTDAVWPSLLAAPLAWYCAFSMFSGGKAQKIPGRVVISLALFAAALAAVALVGGSISRVAKADRRRRIVFASLATAGVIAAGWANAYLVPRLYPWFHEGLAALTLALSLVLASLLLPRKLSWRTTALVAVVVLVPGAFAYQALTRSRQVRFALFDKTAALGTYARFLPLPESKRPSQRTLAATTKSPEAALLQGPKRPAADVILITIDAVRPDHVGAYGYRRPTTPHLDALAAQSTRFERAYTQAPHTSFAATSMLTGKYYPTLLRLKSGEGGDPITTVLRRYGWRTAAFYPPAVFFVEGDKLASFRDTAFGFEYVKIEFMAAEPRIDQIKEYFETTKPEKVFLWVHFFEPHEPYEVHDGHNFGNTDKDRYDSEIAYTDKAVGRFLSYVKSTRPEAIVIVSADHGEEFDEHQGRYHGSSLYEEQVRVPLVIHVPGQQPRTVRGQVELLDVAPTILGLLDIPLPARMKGTDLGPWLVPEGAPDSRLPPAFAEVEDKRMIVDGGHKLICSRSSSVCQLFDLAADPTERRDLIDAQPERALALQTQMEAWLNGQGRFETLTPPDAAEPLPTALQQGRLGEANAVPGLLALVRAQPGSAFGQEAAQLLATLPIDAQTATQLVQTSTAVQDASPESAAWLRVAAYAAGADLQNEVVALLRHEPPATKRRALSVHAALALAERGQAQGEAILIASLAGCDGTALCRRAIAALGALGSRASVLTLHQTMEDPNARLDVVQALARIKDPRSRPVLVQALQHDVRVPVRAAAAAAVAMYPNTASILRIAARREREPSVKAAIAAALHGSKPK